MLRGPVSAEFVGTQNMPGAPLDEKALAVIAPAGLIQAGSGSETDNARAEA